jgi:chromosome segregation ATPase
MYAQLGVRDGEVKLLRSSMQEIEHELRELWSELTRANLRSDEFKKRSEEKSKECMKLASEVAELKDLAQKLDDDLMLKEGEISILREAFSDGEF